MIAQDRFTVRTPGRGSQDITSRVREVVRAAAVRDGLCQVFLRHTSASLMICENADPSVRRDLETFMVRLVPDGDPMFTHTAEGPDDMPAHVRNVLTQTGLTVPVCDGDLALGTWQGIYLWEHRTSPHARQVVVTLLGDGRG